MTNKKAATDAKTIARKTQVPATATANSNSKKSKSGVIRSAQNENFGEAVKIVGGEGVT